MDMTFFRDRLTELRLAKKVSERKMSRDLGHSDSYIRNITSGKSLPSLPEFISICDYLNTSPGKFFGIETEFTSVQNKACDYICKMPDRDVEILLQFVTEFGRK